MRKLLQTRSEQLRSAQEAPETDQLHWITILPKVKTEDSYSQMTSRQD